MPATSSVSPLDSRGCSCCLRHSYLETARYGVVTSRYRSCCLRAPYRVMPRGLYTDSTAGTSSTNRPPGSVDHEFGPRRAEIGAGQRRLCGYPCDVADQLHLQQQDDSSKGGERKFRQDPIMPEQPPIGTQRLDKAG